MPLTDTQIRRSKPHEKPYKLFDGGGLYLHIRPTGSKWWRLKYRIHGKEKLMGLGVYPETSLKEVRERRDAAKKEIKSGADPVSMRREVKRRAVLNAENTFESIATEWHSQQKGRWTPDHAARVFASLKDDAFPYLGAKPIAQITAQEAIEVIRKIERRGALDVASRALQRIGSVFRYAVQTGRIEYNPVADLRGVLKQRKVQHRAALKAADLPEFLVKLDNYRGDPLTPLALRLLLFTFVRPGELRGARWNEFDIGCAEWRIPAERMKMRDEHVVPLSTQALDVLANLQPLTGTNDLLFPNRNRNGKPISENTLTYALYRMGYHKRATAHGFRATASTILNEQGFRPDVIERQLAHAERNKIRAAYHRSEYLMERRRMMQAWADYLDGLVSGEKVVSFKRGRHHQQ